MPSYPRNVEETLVLGPGVLEVSCLWRCHHPLLHLHSLVMMAKFLSLIDMLPDLKDVHVPVHSDNTLVVSFINHKGGLQSCTLCRLAHQILWAQANYFQWGQFTSLGTWLWE